eukprot:maker-scaffold135_size322082-snap-gene-2.13 protein:Tk07971 transcript:maker-scaffold135_size322082-snap-gene-2.13-mRNA-1 annotation:"hypothetical protein KGM_18655"
MYSSHGRGWQRFNLSLIPNRHFPVSLGCGGSSSENCTYLTQTSTTSSGSCVYNICKCSSNICRIRLDFTTFNIARPYEGTLEMAALSDAGAIGDCTSDQFSVTSPGRAGTPVICGFNSGQHMIIDASADCHKAAFTLGSSTTSRSWDIKITQFSCKDNLAGSSGCLQYFTGVSGTVSSFNFPTTATAIPATATHLSEQNYNLCIRREAGYCSICYVPVFADTTNNAVIAQAGFGLSNPAAIVAESASGSQCSSDYLIIPGADDIGGTETLPTKVLPTAPTEGRICGRIFSAETGKAAAMVYATDRSTTDVSVCTQVTPFLITFKTDGNEVSTADSDSSMSELKEFPGGIVGFSLNYRQQKCV